MPETLGPRVNRLSYTLGPETRCDRLSRKWDSLSFPYDHYAFRRECPTPERCPPHPRYSSGSKVRILRQVSIFGGDETLASEAPKEKSECEPRATIMVVVRSMTFCFGGMLRFGCRMRAFRCLGLWSSSDRSRAPSGASPKGSSVAAVSVVGDGTNSLESTHPVFPEAGSTICAQPASRDATRALAPA